MAKDRVGIIGPGRMGLAMLKHLKKHGFDVTVYDIDADQLAAAGDAGGTSATGPRDVRANRDFGVGFEPEVYACLTGDDGALAGLIKELVKDGRTIKATNPPDWSGEGGIAKRP